MMRPRLPLPCHRCVEISLLSSTVLTLAPRNKKKVASIPEVGESASADAENVVAAGRDDGVVRYCPPPLVGYSFLVEICRVVVIPADERYPVVCLAKTSSILAVRLFVVRRLVEAETAVTGNDEQRVCHLILHAKPVHEKMKIPVDVSADNHAFRVGVFVCSHNKYLLKRQPAQESPVPGCLRARPTVPPEPDEESPGTMVGACHSSVTSW